MNLYERLAYEWNRGKMITRLIMINVFVFLLVNIIIGISALFDSYTPTSDFFRDFLALGTDMSKLIFRPWTIITHGFLHFDFLHILYNMLLMYWIGSTLQEYIGSKKILPLYIYCVLAGAILYVASYNIFPIFSNSVGSAVGASAAVLGILWATVALLPNYRISLFFIGSVPLIYIAAGATALDLIGLSGRNAGGAIAHIGGALMGYWYIRLYQKGYDLSESFYDSIDGFMSLFRKRKQPKLKVKRGGKAKQKVSNSSKNSQNTSATGAKSISHESKLNEILDKINEKGYSSLSDKEKAFLKEQSQS